MTQRARRAIIDYWIAKHNLYWRRYYPFFFLLLSFSVVFSETTFAAEKKSEVKLAGALSLVSRESKPTVPAAEDKKPTLLSKILASKKAAPARETEKNKKEKPKYVLPDVNAADEKAEGTLKFLKGTISARSNYGAAVEYDVDVLNGSSKEIWVNFHKQVKLSGMRSLSELGDGDTVSIDYKVTKETKRILLKAITLVSKKPKEEPQPQVPEESEAGTMNPATLATAVKP